MSTLPSGRVNGANAARPLTHLVPLYAACLPPDPRRWLMRRGVRGAARKTPEPKRRNRAAAVFSVDRCRDVGLAASCATRPARVHLTPRDREPRDRDPPLPRDGSKGATGRRSAGR